MKKANITILGAGAFGSALGQVLIENRHEVIFYDPFSETSRFKDTRKVPKLDITTPKKLNVTTDLDYSLRYAEYIVLVVPSAVVPETLKKLPHQVPLIIATKGLLGDALFKDFEDYMVLSGPGFAKDIINHKETRLTATDERVSELFTRDYLTFDITTDKQGVLLCGALKNAYAILAGFEDLAPDTEKQQQFLTEVAGEMQTLLSQNHASPDTVLLSCGQGDLKITCAKPSRNFEFGQILRKNPNAKPEKTVEGVTALKYINRGLIEVPDSAIKMKKLIEMSKKWI